MSRKTKSISITIALIALAVIITVGIRASAVSAVEEVEVVKTFNAAEGQLPEGITMDKSGNIFVTLGAPTFAGGGLGEVWKISPDGTETTLAEFVYPGVSGPAGIVVDAPGNVYFAYPATDPEINGVYHLESGNPIRLPGTENTIVANGLAFDKHGDLFVSDSVSGAIWRISVGKSVVTEIWFQDDLLTGCLPDAPVGANGIAFWKQTLYVANTSKGLLVRIPVLENGAPGEPEIVAGVEDNGCEFDDLVGMDGIALDVHGNVYALLVLQNKLVRIDPSDGTFTTLLTEEDGLWNPASIYFGTGKGGRTNVFISNYAVIPPEPAKSPGPAVLKYNVGVPGLPIP